MLQLRQFSAQLTSDSTFRFIGQSFNISVETVLCQQNVMFQLSFDISLEVES